MSGPCESWVNADSAVLCNGPCAEIDVYVLDECIEVASEFLFELSQRKYPGVCTDNPRPCTQPSGREIWEQRIEYYGDISYWRGGCGCNRGPGCGCTTLSEIKLGARPIVGVDQVILAFDSNPDWPESPILDPMYYRVDNRQRLVRLPNLDGSHPGWPCCQRIESEAGEEHTFEVTFRYGRTPPKMGQRAATDLACQLALACTQNKQCKLPDRMASIVRQGVSMVLIDPFQFFDKGKLGIWSVDAFLATVNPRGYRGFAQIVSPDLHRSVRRTNTGEELS